MKMSLKRWLCVPRILVAIHKKKIYTTRSEARTDIFEYIEMLYNSKRRHGPIGQHFPLEYKKSHFKRAMYV
jgi:putative transposase